MEHKVALVAKLEGYPSRLGATARFVSQNGCGTGFGRFLTPPGAEGTRVGEGNDLLFGV